MRPQVFLCLVLQLWLSVATSTKDSNKDISCSETDLINQALVGQIIYGKTENVQPEFRFASLYSSTTSVTSTTTSALAESNFLELNIWETVNAKLSEEKSSVYIKCIQLHKDSNIASLYSNANRNEDLQHASATLQAAVDSGEVHPYVPNDDGPSILALFYLNRVPAAASDVQTNNTIFVANTQHKEGHIILLTSEDTTSTRANNTVTSTTSSSTTSYTLANVFTIAPSEEGKKKRMDEKSYRMLVIDLILLNILVVILIYYAYNWRRKRKPRHTKFVKKVTNYKLPPAIARDGHRKSKKNKHVSFRDGRPSGGVDSNEITSPEMTWDLSSAWEDPHHKGDASKYNTYDTAGKIEGIVVEEGPYEMAKTAELDFFDGGPVRDEFGIDPAYSEAVRRDSPLYALTTVPEIGAVTFPSSNLRNNNHVAHYDLVTSRATPSPLASPSSRVSCDRIYYTINETLEGNQVQTVRRASRLHPQGTWREVGDEDEDAPRDPIYFDCSQTLLMESTDTMSREGTLRRSSDVELESSCCSTQFDDNVTYDTADILDIPPVEPSYDIASNARSSVVSGGDTVFGDNIGGLNPIEFNVYDRAGPNEVKPKLIMIGPPVIEGISKASRAMVLERQHFTEENKQLKFNKRTTNNNSNNNKLPIYKAPADISAAKAAQRKQKSPPVSRTMRMNGHGRPAPPSPPPRLKRPLPILPK
eukprot:m.9843 g.9843  ORF g.9843 m.9843 type:complete len:702 (+) comp4147_c0_seq1:83-2188(+)